MSSKNSSAVFLYEFQMCGLEFKAFWMPGQGRWFVQNHRAEFDFPGTDEMGKGRVKAELKKVLRKQYQFLLDNASRVIVRIGSIEGYLDGFPYRVRKQWAKAAILLPQS